MVLYMRLLLFDMLECCVVFMDGGWLLIILLVILSFTGGSE
jgi:hypothetical protein